MKGKKSNVNIQNLKDFTSFKFDRFVSNDQELEYSNSYTQQFNKTKRNTNRSNSLSGKSIFVQSK